jgi:hypothetical protein
MAQLSTKIKQYVNAEVDFLNDVLFKTMVKVLTSKNGT